MGEEPKRDEVRRRYAAIAVSVREGEGSSCCGSDAGGVLDPEARGVDWTAGSYSEVEKRELPQAAVEASLGCGNPVALATLSPGEVVLDLGSGGGIDVLLSAGRVSPGGKAYGLDMTDEMLELAASGCCGGLDLELALGEVSLASAFVRARRKPVAG